MVWMVRLQVGNMLLLVMRLHEKASGEDMGGDCMQAALGVTYDQLFQPAFLLA